MIKTTLNEPKKVITNQNNAKKSLSGNGVYGQQMNLCKLSEYDNIGNSDPSFPKL